MHLNLNPHQVETAAVRHYVCTNDEKGILHARDTLKQLLKDKNMLVNNNLY